MTGGHGANLERVTSGIPGLDTILGGGFLRGGLYIVQGPPGAGKTTFGNQVCFHHIARGGRALYITLLAEYHARMMQHLGVMSFFDKAMIPDRLAYFDGLQVLHDDGLKGLLTLLRGEITARSASVLVLDGIISARRAAADEQAFSEFVHELQAIAIATECTVFALTSAQEGHKVTPEHTMVDGIIELADQLTEWAAGSSLQVVKFRGSAFLRGRHAFKITGDGIIVYPRIEALLSRPSRPDTETPGGKRVSTGSDQLDVMLGGGLPACSTTMVMGPSGTGKTTMGLHFLSGSTADEPGLLFGFYETPVRIGIKAADVCPELSGQIEAGTVEVMWQPPTDDLLDAYGHRLLEAVHRRRVRRLFIDGLGALQYAAGSHPRRIGNFLTALMNELRVLGVTTVYTLEVPDIMGPNIRNPIGDLSSLAENLILLRFVELGADLHRLVSVLKVRDSAFDSSLYEYVTSSRGLLIRTTTATAQHVTTSSALGRNQAPVADETPPQERGG